MFYFSALRGKATCHPRKGIIPFLSAVLAAELSCVVSFIVNNAFSFSYTLKFVLKHFRKLVEAESYFNFKSLGPSTSVPPVFSPILFPVSFSLFHYYFSVLSLRLDFKKVHWFLALHNCPGIVCSSAAMRGKSGWLTPVLVLFSNCPLKWLHQRMASCQLVKSPFESTAHFTCSERSLSS